MKKLIEYSLKFTLVLILIFTASCAVKKYIWTITPEFANAENEHYRATVTPFKDSDRFFVSFGLDVVNKSNEEIRIDWNKTKYINNGRVSGVFVFRGIKPEDIKTLSIPDDIIPPGIKYSKTISPFSMLAMSKLRSKKDWTYAPGILPNGRNGISLVIKLGGKEFVENLSFVIKEMSE